MFDSVVSSFGAVSVTSNVAFNDGSSQHGKARRASVASNCVVAMKRFSPCSSAYSLR